MDSLIKNKIRWLGFWIIILVLLYIVGLLVFVNNFIPGTLGYETHYHPIVLFINLVVLLFFLICILLLLIKRKELLNQQHTLIIPPREEKYPEQKRSGIIKCKKCDASIPLSSIFTGRLCPHCTLIEKRRKENEEKRREQEEKKRLQEELKQEKIEEAKQFLNDCGVHHQKQGYTFNPWNASLSYTKFDIHGVIRIYLAKKGKETIIKDFEDSPLHHIFIKNYNLIPKKYRGVTFSYSEDFDELINKVIKKDFDKEKFIEDLFNSAMVDIEKKKIEERMYRHDAKIEAEKQYFGKSNDKRRDITNDEKEGILTYYNNECAICRAKEGLHIHHKDKNPNNNQNDNLIVLCGVCHKKTHMNVR
jgi:hypothetical protein